ncbi:succinylglutamate desuccinylase/aspartoacylase family protein [bacterium]|nr:succinylglutamate desuccinylase/aspartoacylase family protein [bacterium]
MKKHLVFLSILAVTAAVIIEAASLFSEMSEMPTENPGKGVTEIRMLSRYWPNLKGTAGDTEVFVLRGEKPGASMLILGGTHPNEPASNVAATVLIEHAKVNEGCLYIITRANRSGFTHNDPTEGYPQHYSIPLPDGSKRIFRFGSRATNPVHQWPDPDIYIHESGQALSGAETRNLNRAYPGKPDGTLTEQIAYSIVQLIKTEAIDISIDLHEASPEYPVINAIVAHNRAFELAAVSMMALDMEGLPFSLEPSPVNLRGLSHREWGDSTDTLALLMESANAIQGRLRGKTDEALIMTAKDSMYVRAAQLGRLYVDYSEKGHPLEERVGRHIAGIRAIIDAYNTLDKGKIFEVEKFPEYGELQEKGIGYFLNPLSKLLFQRFTA